MQNSRTQQTKIKIIGYNVRRVLTIAQHTTEPLRLGDNIVTSNDPTAKHARICGSRVAPFGCHRSEHVAAAVGYHGDYLLAQRAADLSEEALGNKTCQKMLAHGEACPLDIDDGSRPCMYIYDGDG